MDLDFIQHNGLEKLVGLQMFKWVWTHTIVGRFNPKLKLLPGEIQNIARRKLRMINNAQNINDLRIPPANHLEKLSGKLAGYYSIRINKQWRIIFKWENETGFKV